jgi:uncharacterized membrane protein
VSTDADEIADRRDTNRLEAFSDAVIAIAITLLVIEIHVPEVEAGHSLWDALVDLWPNYLGYVTSFAIIGIMWINHHNLFKLMVRVDHPMLAINLLLMLTIGFLPFTTALAAEYLKDEGERTAVMVYSGWLVVSAVVFNLLWWYAAHRGKLLAPGTSAAVIRGIDRSYLMGLGGYVVAFLLAIVSPLACLLLLLLLALFFILPRASAG